MKTAHLERNTFFKKNLLLQCKCMMCGCEQRYMWAPKNKFWGQFSPSTMVPGIELKWSGLVASVFFSYWVVSPVQKQFDACRALWQMEGWSHRVVGSNKLITLNEDHNLTLFQLKGLLKCQEISQSWGLRSNSSPWAVDWGFFNSYSNEN